MGQGKVGSEGLFTTSKNERENEKETFQGYFSQTAK